MNDLVTIGLINAAAATVLAIVVLAVSWLVRAPALRHCLWLLVLGRLLMPPVLHVPLWPSGPESAAEMGECQLVENDVQAEELSPAPARASRTERVTPARFSAAPITIQSCVAGGWLLGSLGMGTLLARRVWRFQQVLGLGTPAPLEVREQAEAVARRCGLRSCPPIQLVAAAVSPLVWVGWGRPRLILPAGLWPRLDREARATLLAHEFAHLRRRDHWVRRLEVVVLVLYWWHPVVWLARRELHESEEACCDAWVAWVLPTAVDAYAQALLETVSFIAKFPPGLGLADVPLVVPAAGVVRRLKRRLTMIVQGTTKRRLGWTEVTALLGLGVMLLAVFPSAAVPPANSVPAQVNPKNPQEAQVWIADGVIGPKLTIPQPAPQLPSAEELKELLESAIDEADVIKAQVEGKKAEVELWEIRCRQEIAGIVQAKELMKKGLLSSKEVPDLQSTAEIHAAMRRSKLAEVQQVEIRLRQALRRVKSLEATRAKVSSTTAPAPVFEGKRLEELERRLTELQKEIKDIKHFAPESGNEFIWTTNGFQLYAPKREKTVTPPTAPVLSPVPPAVDPRSTPTVPLNKQ